MKTLIVFITALLFSATAYAAGLTIDKSATNTDLSAVTGSITIDGSAIGGGGAAGWTLIQAQTASGASTINFTTGIDSTYSAYVFVITNIDVSADGANFGLRTDQNGGASFDTANYHYTTTTVFDDTTSYSMAVSSGNSVMVIAVAIGNAADEAGSFTIYMANPSGTSFDKRFWWNGASDNATNQVTRSTGAGKHESIPAINAVQFLTNSGTFSGELRLYGIVK